LTSDRDTRDTACATDGHRWWRSADGTAGPTGRDGVRHSLTYRVAMATSAANLVLLGDPQQLPHIQEASIRVTPRVRRWRICSSMRRPLPRTAASSGAYLPHAPCGLWLRLRARIWRAASQCRRMRTAGHYVAWLERRRHPMQYRAFVHYSR